MLCRSERPDERVRSPGSAGRRRRGAVGAYPVVPVADGVSDVCRAGGDRRFGDAVDGVVAKGAVSLDEVIDVLLVYVAVFCVATGKVAPQHIDRIAAAVAARLPEYLAEAMVWKEQEDARG